MKLTFYEHQHSPQSSPQIFMNPKLIHHTGDLPYPNPLHPPVVMGANTLCKD
jgi:hypothetical protein